MGTFMFTGKGKLTMAVLATVIWVFVAYILEYKPQIPTPGMNLMAGLFVVLCWIGAGLHIFFRGLD